MRDITRQQFVKKMKSYGFTPHGFMGYWGLPEPYTHCSVCEHNGGTRYRSRLAYMLEQVRIKDASQNSVR